MAAPQQDVDGPTKVRFLLEMSSRFERDGNVSEAVKSAETALLLRRSLPPDTQPLFAASLSQQAADLVMRCNALGVAQFQNDEYHVSEFLLGKALFFTDDTPTVNCFGAMEHDRLRLRAATFNNLGCMEKRRGRHDRGLEYLHKAAELESLVDPDAGPSPSTLLNLCTLFNKMGRHEQAAAAAERAVRQLEFARAQGMAVTPSMVLMAYYNHGVSLEFVGRSSDIAKARESYNNCIKAGAKYGLDAASNSALAAAGKALHRLQGETTPQATTAMAGSGIHVARARDSYSTASSEAITPRPPASSLRQAPPLSRGIMTAPSASDQVSKHRERLQMRQRRKEEDELRVKEALRRAQLAHNREKNEKMRIAEEKAAREREELAKKMYETMETAIRRDRIRALLLAATRVQKVWRGFLVRSHLRDMAVAVTKMQAVVRSHLARCYLRRQRDQAIEEARSRAEMQTRLEAAVVIQRRARRFLRRCSIVREYKARQLRRRSCARRIWKFYRAYRQRVADKIREKMEADRRAAVARQARLNEAARKIQTLYRSFKSRRFMRVVRHEQIRRNAAATRIQATMRGCLTRAWFKHYRLYRREQELSTASNLRGILRIQCAWRCALARRERRRRTLEKRNRERLQLLFRSARRIQCVWRCFIARRDALSRRRAVQRRHSAATLIQRKWHAFKCRTEFLWHRNEARKLRALRHIQAWWRAMIIRKRHVETARYHARMLARERELKARTYIAVTLAAAMRFRGSTAEMERRRIAYSKRAEAAAVIQRTARGDRGRRDVSMHKRIVLRVARSEEMRRRAHAAACVIQRATRVFLAKEKCNRKRRERWACVRIQAMWRVALARRAVRRLRALRDAAARDRAARRIQKSTRLYLTRKELQRLDDFYKARRRQKLLEQRRHEAATTIQAHWRGFVTRLATADARRRLLAQTIQAMRIQRAFRAHRFRRSINAEFARRRRNRERRNKAAVRIQSFWRRVLATDYVTLLRERKFNHTVHAICIQCAWRRYQAKHELQRRLSQRSVLQKRNAAQHDVWMLATTLLQAVLRYRRDADATLVRHEQQLHDALETKRRIAFLRRSRAATKIAATYRGYYERVYARGLRAEARERERIRREVEAKRTRASVRIQCAVRCHWARCEVSRRRTAKRLLQLEHEALLEETADPNTVVKNMFWAHEGLLKRNLAKERLQRNQRQDAAATNIQRVVRGSLAKRRVSRMRREKAQYMAQAEARREAERQASESEAALQAARGSAAVKIQALARRYLVRKHWPELEERLARRKVQPIVDEERRDAAATRIQSVYRGHLARDFTQTLIDNRAVSKMHRIQFEAARLIQKHTRRLLAKNRVTRLRFAKLQRGERGNDASFFKAPVPPTAERPPHVPTGRRSSTTPP